MTSATDKFGFRAFFLEGFDDGCSRVCVEVCDDDEGSFCGEFATDNFTDSLTTSSDQGDFAIEAAVMSCAVCLCCHFVGEMEERGLDVRVV
jgi:hypothetical protein